MVEVGDRDLGVRVSADGRTITAWSSEPYLVGMISRTGSRWRRWEVRVYRDRFLSDRVAYKRVTRYGALATMARVFADESVRIDRLIRSLMEMEVA